MATIKQCDGCRKQINPEAIFTPSYQKMWTLGFQCDGVEQRTFVKDLCDECSKIIRHIITLNPKEVHEIIEKERKAS